MTLAPGWSRNGHPYWTEDGGHPRWLAVTHGSFGDHRDFIDALAPLASRYNLLFWDLPGHGASTAAPARRLAHVADALAEVMEAAGIASAHQLGFSFGGMAAQCFARRYHDKTQSLIAYACVPITLSELKGARLINLIAQVQLAMTPWPAFCQAFAQQVSVRAHLQESFAARMLQHKPALRNAIYEAMIFGVSNEPDFRFAAPVAQIKGARDDRFPGAKAQMDTLSALLPPERVAEIEDAGHLAHLEQPAAFTAVLTRLLKTLEAP